MDHPTCDVCDRPATHHLCEVGDGRDTTRHLCADHAPDTASVTDGLTINEQLAAFIRQTADDVAKRPELFEQANAPDREQYLAELRRAADDLEAGR